jgi:transketolase
MASRSAPTRSPAPRKSSAGFRAPFEVPDDVLQALARRRQRGAAAQAPNGRRFAPRPASAPSSSAACGRAPAALADGDRARSRRRSLAEPQKIATRKASEIALEVGQRRDAGMIGGSADLTGSNNTKHQGPEGDVAPGRLFRAASSITASASTAWRRP